MGLDHLFDNDNFSQVHLFACLLGVLLSVYVMQAAWQFEVAVGEAGWLRECHRVFYSLLALSFLWALSYARETAWTPWPPDLMIIVVVDACLLLRAITIHVSSRRMFGRSCLLHLARRR